MLFMRKKAISLQTILLHTIIVLIQQQTIAGKNYCNQAELDALYPCGNVNALLGFHASRNLPTHGVNFMYLHRVGQYCIGFSADTSGGKNSNLDWQSAKSQCEFKKMDLLEFTDPDVRSWVLNNVNAPAAWTSGRRERNRQPFYWHRRDGKTRVADNNPFWSTRRRGAHGHCIAYFKDGRGMRYTSCRTPKQWLCQAFESEYYLDRSLSVSRPSAFYKVGEKFTIICKSRARRPLKLHIESTNVSWVAQSNYIRYGDWSNLMLTNFVGSVRYDYIYQRCFAWHTISFDIGVIAILHQATIKCCPKDDLCETHNLGEVRHVPWKPYVTVDNDVFKRFLFVGDIVTYYCLAKLGLGETMTVVIQQSGTNWARTYLMNSSMDEEYGTFWQGVDLKGVDIESGYSVREGGNYIKFTLKFEAHSYLDGIPIACYSDNVLGKVRARTISKNDAISNWLTLGITAGPQKPRIEFKDLPDAVDGKVPAYGCQVFTVTCEAAVGGGGELKIEFDVPGAIQHDFFVWSTRNLGDNHLVDWVKINNVTESIHQENGRTYNVSIDIYFAVRGLDFVRGVICKSIEGERILEAKYPVDFEIRVGSLPPDLTAVYVNETEDAADYYQLNCSAVVGEPGTQTWRIVDSQGREYHWFVYRSGSVRGLARLDWVDISLLDATSTDMCGWKLTSKLTVYPPDYYEGFTVFCYSVDIWRNFSSPYTLEELVASYAIQGGGVPPEPPELSGDIWFVYFVVIVYIAALLIILPIVVMLCRMAIHNIQESKSRSLALASNKQELEAPRTYLLSAELAATSDVGLDLPSDVNNPRKSKDSDRSKHSRDTKLEGKSITTQASKKSSVMEGHKPS